MPNLNDPINNTTEFSGSTPLRTSPTDKQMGLGTHDFFKKKAKEQKNSQKNS